MVHRLDPAVADVRRAVRTGLADLDPGDRVLVGCSGGADSLALAAATAFESGSLGVLAGVLIVDHGLQTDSAEVAAAIADRVRAHPAFAGLTRVEVRPVTVGHHGGPEAAARIARYAALDDAAAAERAVVLLGHTRDDQAETVLLGLARGSGVRSLAGMRAVSGRYRRPLLGLPRRTTMAACQALDIPVWTDPANADTSFARVRVRSRILPTMESELGPGVSAALARTAHSVADDADLLDQLAADLMADATTERGLSAAVLSTAPPALRSRVLRSAAIGAGCPPGDLFAVHVEAMDRLVIGWHGQRGVDLPGRITARRRDDRIVFEGP